MNVRKFLLLKLIRADAGEDLDLVSEALQRRRKLRYVRASTPTATEYTDSRNNSAILIGVIRSSCYGLFH